MKNIIEIIKNIALNKRGAATQNVLRGLSVGVFASVIGYGVYTAYNNSPAYNPERRALFIAENQNLSVNSLNPDGTALDVSDGIPDGMQNLYGEFGKGPSGETMQDRINQNEADFENARTFLNGQRGGGYGAPAETGPSIPAAQRGQVTQWGQSGQPLRPEALQTSQPAPVRNIENEISPVLSNAVRNQAGQNPNSNLTVKGGVKGSVRGAVDKGGNPSGGTGGTGVGVDGTVVPAGQPVAGGQDPKGGTPAKGGKQNVRNANRNKPAGTTINRLSNSGGSNNNVAGSPSGGSSGGGFSIGGTNLGGSKGGNNDGGPQTLPVNNDGGKNGGKAFKFGRNSNMGGYNVARGGTGIDNSKGNATDGTSDLKNAHTRSRLAGKSLRTPGGKEGAAYNAAAAFDGSAGDAGGDIEGDQINTGNLRGLDDANYGDIDSGKVTNKLKADPTTQYDLLGCVQTHLLRALLAAIAAAYVLSILKKMADAGGPWGWAIWIAIAAVAISAMYSIWFMDYDGNGRYIWEDLSDLWKLNSEHGDSQGFWEIACLPLLGIFSAGVILSIVFGTQIAKALSKFQESLIGKGVTTWAMGKVVSEGKSNISNVSKKLK